MHTEGAVATEPVIRVRGLIKRYGDLVAVDGIDFDVAAGEVFGLLGPNGAGKTTTVEILEGLRTPGRRPGDRSSASTWRDGADSLKPRIGVSLQTAAMYPKLTVVEIIDLFRSFYPRPAPTDELIDMLELGERRERADQGPVGRPAPASRGRPGAGQRPRAHLPRRADDRVSIRRPGAPCGTSSGASRPTAGRSC